MPLRSTEAGWGALVRAFHWLVAALIIAQGVIGLAMVQMGLTPAKVRVFALHKSIGITILALVLLRIAWRLTERHPADPPSMPPWQRRASPSRWSRSCTTRSSRTDPRGPPVRARFPGTSRGVRGRTWN